MVKRVQHTLQEAQNQHKIYLDLKKRPQEFQIGGHVYIKFKSRRRYLNIGYCSNLAPRLYGPFKILT